MIELTVIILEHATYSVVDKNISNLSKFSIESKLGDYYKHILSLKFLQKDIHRLFYSLKKSQKFAKLFQ